MRLIDADVLKEKFKVRHWIVGRDSDPDCLLDDAPTVDAVQVVRCRDCKWGKEACGNIECFVDLNVPTEYHGYDWFCPNGEGKDDATD